MNVLLGILFGLLVVAIILLSANSLIKGSKAPDNTASTTATPPPPPPPCAPKAPGEFGKKVMNMLGVFIAIVVGLAVVSGVGLGLIWLKGCTSSDTHQSSDTVSEELVTIQPGQDYVISLQDGEKPYFEAPLPTKVEFFNNVGEQIYVSNNGKPVIFIIESPQAKNEVDALDEPIAMVRFTSANSSSTEYSFKVEKH